MPLRRTRPLVSDAIGEGFALQTAAARTARIADLFAATPLYAILDPSVRPDLPRAAILDSLLRAGVKVVQYRRKEAFSRAHFEECRALASRAHEFGGRFFVNDRADIAELCGADGVHLGQEDLPPDKARSFLGAAKLIGYSTHNLEQARSALALPIDYLALGPIFPTSSKRNPDPVVGLGLISEIRALTKIPLVAIGGIRLENASAVIEAGADAVAVISGLLAAPDIEARAREFLGILTGCEIR